MNHEASEVVSTEALPRTDERRQTAIAGTPEADVIIENECFWIRNALGIKEQIEVFGDILERSKNVDNTQKRPCMNPSPKTLVFDGHKSTLRFGKKRDNDENGDTTASSSSLSSVYERLILRKASSFVSHYVAGKQRRASGQQLLLNCDRYSVGVIRYAAPNGSFPEHIDHCNDSNGWVFLLSLGCTARFSVQKRLSKNYKNTTTITKKNEKFLIELNSGDILVFDPSSEAAILHGVVSILPSTCPEALVQAFGEESMANHRYGVQCRTSLED